MGLLNELIDEGTGAATGAASNAIETGKEAVTGAIETGKDIVTEKVGTAKETAAEIGSVVTEKVTDTTAEVKENVEAEAEQVIEAAQAKISEFQELITVGQEALAETSGKSDPVEGFFFVLGRDIIPELSRKIAEKLGSAIDKLPPFIRDDLGGFVLDAIIMLFPIGRIFGPQFATIIKLMTAVSWGAKAIGPILEGLIVTYFGEGSIAREFIQRATQVVSAANPRLILVSIIRWLNGGGARKLAQGIGEQQQVQADIAQAQADAIMSGVGKVGDFFGNIADNWSENQQQIQNTGWGLIPQGQNRGGKVKRKGIFKR